jgi:glycosyltransferase involved in cell wall biosynthesis
MDPPRVLLSAYQCAPGTGSVSQIGWEWYSRLSQQLPVTLITHSRNRERLAAAGAPFFGSSVLYIDTEWFARPLYRLASFLFRNSEHLVFLVSSLDFFLYDLIAVKTLRRFMTRFDLIHAVTPVSPLAVTRLHKLGAPLIVGPWNGGVSTPSGLKEIMRADSEWLYALRSFGRMFDRLTGCTRNASRVLSATGATDRCLAHNVAAERMLENGVDLDLFHPRPENIQLDGPELRVLFVGRLIPAKGLSMLIAAVAKVRSVIPILITIVGEGKFRETLERQVVENDLSRLITFVGPKTQVQIASLMREHHLFCLPSVRESGGAVLLEAMASGIPVVAIANGGPGELVDDDVGRALLPTSPQAVIEGLTQTFMEAYRFPVRWHQRGLHGRRRAETSYGWRTRIERAMKLYRTVLEDQNGW